MKRVINRKGYITLEAALFVPILILAVISIGYYINIYAAMENVMFSTVEETARLASKASVVKVVPGFKSTLLNRMETDSPDIKNAEIKRFRYLYSDGDLNNLIAVYGTYDMEMDLPLGFDHTAHLENRVKCRGFTGIKTDGDPMTFEEMESEGSWDPVWVFPASGEKYHSEICTYVKANAREMVLTGDLKRRYDPCSLCEAAALSVGAYVYCFPGSGEAYHRDNCKQVKRYAIEINKEDASRKGYTPCSKCGGG